MQTTLVEIVGAPRGFHDTEEVAELDAACLDVAVDLELVRDCGLALHVVRHLWQAWMWADGATQWDDYVPPSPRRSRRGAPRPRRAQVAPARAASYYGGT